MSIREIVHLRVGTDNLCPDCTTPMIVLESLGETEAGALRMYHDVECAAVRNGSGRAVSAARRNRVAEIRIRHLNFALEGWSESA